MHTAMSYKNLKEIEEAAELLSPPGDTLREMLEERGMTGKELARRMGDRPEKTISEILNGKAEITPETAQQLEYALGAPAEFWLERERRYRLERAQLLTARQQLEQVEWANEFPLAKMKQLGWLAWKGKNPADKVDAIYTFFAVASPAGYQAQYAAATAAYRMGKAEKSPQAVNAWLRRGEVQAAELAAPQYDRAAFKAALDGPIRQMMVSQPDKFFDSLQQLCLAAGVKVVHTPCLPGAQLNGAVRWLADTPLIQLSNHYKRNDLFWFTFYHEAGHILLHGKKDLYVEGLQYTHDGKKKEDEADNLAASYTCPPQHQQALQQHLAPLRDWTEKARAIKNYAPQVPTHPAMLAGCLARLGYLDQNFGNAVGFYKKIELENA